MTNFSFCLPNKCYVFWVILWTKKPTKIVRFGFLKEFWFQLEEKKIVHHIQVKIYPQVLTHKFMNVTWEIKSGSIIYPLYFKWAKESHSALAKNSY